MRLIYASVLVIALATFVGCSMYGSQSITPHDYQSLGTYLAASAPSCGYPYATLDISRITAVQLMDTRVECGTCLRIETSQANYITDGLAVGLPEIAMATHFAATTSQFDPLPTTSIQTTMDKRDDKVRFVYVLAVDTGGRGLDLAQVSFTALFGQSLSPMDAAWFPVNAKYCEDIWRNSTKQQMQGPTSMSDIKVGVGRSQAPPGLGPIEYSGEYNGEYSAAQTRHFGFLRLPIYMASLSCVLFLLTNV